MSETSQARVLIVDDERLNINLLNDVLKEDYLIKVAMNGEQALERAVTDPRPDIILLDIDMPGLDGFQVCERLQAAPETKEIPIIFITARDSEEDEVRGLEIGGRDFITKPIRPQIVQARVKTQITQLLQKRELKRMHQQVLELSNTDALTGIANRRFFDDFIQQEWGRSIRSGNTLGLVMMDIDHFKLFNDHYGHAAGDDCLQQVAQAMEKRIRRPPDLLARYGGEEFVCVLPDTDLDGVRSVCQTLVDTVSELNIPHEKSLLTNNVTLSVGGTTLAPDRDNSPQQLIEAADALLYRTKESGRNGFTVEAPGV